MRRPHRNALFQNGWAVCDEDISMKLIFNFFFFFCIDNIDVYMHFIIRCPIFAHHYYRAIMMRPIINIHEDSQFFFNVGSIFHKKTRSMLLMIVFSYKFCFAEY